LGEDRLEELWLIEKQEKTIYSSLQPLLQGSGDISVPHLEMVGDQLALLVGDIGLCELESYLAEFWLTCSYIQDNHRRELAFRFISAFWRILQQAAIAHEANIILIDLGSSLSAINHTALIAADYIIVPLFLDFFPLKAFVSLGMTLQDWRQQWQEVLEKKNSLTNIELPLGKMEAMGYVVIRHQVRFDRPVRNYQNLITQIPEVYREAVLNQLKDGSIISMADDSHCLAVLQNYQLLMPMAIEAQKPLFHLKPADGVLGGSFVSVKRAYKEFQALASKISERTQLNKSFQLR
jgi:chromosome partitioning protein